MSPGPVGYADLQLLPADLHQAAQELNRSEAPVLCAGSTEAMPYFLGSLSRTLAVIPTPMRRRHSHAGLGTRTGRLTRSRTIPPLATAVKNGMANGASLGPNHSSNMGTSSPARRWKIPSGQPLAATNATPSPTMTPTESRNHRSRLRVRAHNHRQAKQPSSPAPIALWTALRLRARRLSCGRSLGTGPFWT